ncbi:hypothetical protein Z950_1042 [Sulfitobacter mediterraneus KCTC 32188]|nr:hypothetical protein Z950_1042 [Sulfitobacter mediterraneus KCTC 32188]
MQTGGHARLGLVQATVNIVKRGKCHHCGIIGENGRHDCSPHFSYFIGLLTDCSDFCLTAGFCANTMYLKNRVNEGLNFRVFADGTDQNS